MAIIINIDVMLAKRKMSVTALADKVGITMANLSVLKNGKAKAIRLSTLEAICKALECQPGDILEYKNGASDATILAQRIRTTSNELSELK
jgi:putative transcriptional regulator